MVSRNILIHSDYFQTEYSSVSDPEELKALITSLHLILKNSEHGTNARPGAYSRLRSDVI